MKLRWWPSRSRQETKAPAFAELEQGWQCRVDNDTHPASAYVEQLIDEGFAEAGEGSAVIPWNKLYELLASEEHQSSLPLLGLPPEARVAPSLRSHGTPAESSFRITAETWLDASGAAIDATRTGAIVSTSGERTLMPQPAFALIQAMEDLAGKGGDWSADQRMLQMGRIQKLARDAGARMDRYMEVSPVVVPETVSIELQDRSTDTTERVELALRPEGAPDGWLGQFDRFDKVRGRYDVSGDDGALAHVLLPDPVREVAESVKALPERQLTGSQVDVFVQNPYAILGDSAADIVSPDAFNEAKRSAGFAEWELDLQPADAQGSWDAVLIDPLGHVESEFGGTVGAEQLTRLLEDADQASALGTGIVRWNRRRILLSGVTLESLARVRRLNVEQALDGPLAVESLFDLTHYSARVVGFDGKTVVVPQLRKPPAGEEWIRGDIDYCVVDANTGASERRHLKAEDVEALRERVVAAEQHGHGSVAIPGGEHEIPTAEGRAWVDAIKELVSSGGQRKLSAPANPEPSEKLSLRIMHNIEELEYRSEEAPAVEQDTAYEAPAALRPDVVLKHHQVRGIAWMQGRMRQRGDGVRGVLLADDMGLGKTLQALALMAWYRQTAPTPRPCLIVAPVSLLENWKAEIAKFLDGRQGVTITLYGEHLSSHRLSARELGEELRQLGVKKALSPGFARDAAFVLTTYETLRDYQLSLAREHWGVLVCDEAQKIKTPSAMVTRAAKAMQADFKIACTGTPVENSLADLWCLFDFFQPGLLDSLSRFTKTFRQNIELRAEGHEQQVEVLRSQISPWVLRRMKSEVADLQPKTEVPCKLAMSSRQRQLYSVAAREFRDAVDAEGGGGTTALTRLHRLRMICANPLAASSDNAELLPMQDHLRDSPKLAWLIDMLQTIRARGEKAIVFTEFRDIQRLIQRAVASRFDIRPAIVNGSTSVEAGSDESRQAIIDTFQRKPGFGVIVLSTTAVGFGVNIQAANHVIHFTRPWNPAKEDQATDRAYRIGQEKEVFVYYPTIMGDGFESFEERVAERLAAKRSLSNDMLAPEQALTLQEFTDLPG